MTFGFLYTRDGTPARSISNAETIKVNITGNRQFDTVSPSSYRWNGTSTSTFTLNENGSTFFVVAAFIAMDQVYNILMVFSRDADGKLQVQKSESFGFNQTIPAQITALAKSTLCMTPEKTQPKDITLLNNAAILTLGALVMLTMGCFKSFATATDIPTVPTKLMAVLRWTIVAHVVLWMMRAYSANATFSWISAIRNLQMAVMHVCIEFSIITVAFALGNTLIINALFDTKHTEFGPTYEFWFYYPIFKAVMTIVAFACHFEA